MRPFCSIRTFVEPSAGKMCNRSANGPWYCPSPALLLVAKTLVLLYRVEGDVDWSSICELIAETLPDVISKIEEPKGYPRRLDPTPS